MNHSGISLQIEVDFGPIDPNAVARPYASRTTPLPRGRFRPDGAWLGELMAHKYPGLKVESYEVVEIIDSHATKVRCAVKWNHVGTDARLPSNLCIKATGPAASRA